MSLIAGIDIGGTFTDLVLLDKQTGEVRVDKVPSTPGDLSIGLIDALKQSNAGPDVELIVHGTTVATNAILERKGARCGLLATSGFRDVLELRRRDRPHAYGLTGTYEPLVPRDLRLEVPERVSAEGEILHPVDRGAVVKAAEKLVAEGVEVIVIAFLNSYANPANERDAGVEIRARWPEMFVVASSDVLPVYREFERTSTAVVNGYIQPVVSAYLDRLQHRLADERRFGGDLLVMQSNGGMIDARAVGDLPINTVFSGPAAGVIAASRLGAEAGFDNLISYDMGGTSLDVSLIVDGQPQSSNGIDVEFGIPVQVSMIDVQTIGAGGGSIARVDPGGLLQIGPDSAGASPGPVCYAKGGTEPTVTDALVVLGRINAARPISGGVGDCLDIAAAASAIARNVGEPLGLTTEEAAQAIVTVANNIISGSVRRVSIDRGHDPRDFALFAFGGGGPLFVSQLISELSIAHGLVPPHPGIASAWGCAVADIRRDFVHMVNRRLDDIDLLELQAVIDQHVVTGSRFVEQTGVSIKEMKVIVEADMGYEGQTHVIRTTLQQPLSSTEDIKNSFQAAYGRHYAHADTGYVELAALLDSLPVHILNLRTSVVGLRPSFKEKLATNPGGDVDSAFSGSRKVYFEGAFRDCPTYDRSHLPWDAQLEGPVVIEQVDTTVWVEPGTSLRVAEGGSLVLQTEHPRT